MALQPGPVLKETAAQEPTASRDARAAAASRIEDDLEAIVCGELALLLACVENSRSIDRGMDVCVCVAIDGAAGHVFMGGGGMDVRRPAELVGRLVRRRPT